MSVPVAARTITGRRRTGARSAADDQSMDEGLWQLRGTHASLHFSNIIRDAPEFNDVMFQVRDGESGARITVAGLADGPRIEQVAALRLDAKRRE